MVASPSYAVNTGGFVDCHCHLLSGVDDGPAGSEESVEMAAVLASFGFSRVYCTPHFIRGAYECRPELLQEEAQRLQEALYRRNVPIVILPAAEYYLDEYLSDTLARPLTLWNNIILLEAHRHVHSHLLAETAYHIVTAKRLRPLIAHPERYELLGLPKRGSGSSGILSWFRRSRSGQREYQETDRAHDRDPDIFTKLRDMGCLLQGNIGSFAGIYGDHIRKRALTLLQSGAYDLIGTDAHRAQGLHEWLKAGLDVIEREIGREQMTRLLRLPDGHSAA